MLSFKEAANMKNHPKILIAEDDEAINRLIYKLLKKNNYDAVQAFSGTEACMRLDMESFDLLILDLMMPGMDGCTLLKKLRTEKSSQLPVLILSAKTSLTDKVQLLTKGADDYMTKPFEPEELLARIYACLRRSSGYSAEKSSVSSFTYKALCLIPDARKVTVKGEELILTPHEYEILSILIQSPDKVFSRETLYEKVWNGGYYGEDNTVNVHISNLRKKLAATDSNEEYIKTVWGIGFKMA